MLLVYVESGLAVIKQIHSIFFHSSYLYFDCLTCGCNNDSFLYSVQTSFNSLDATGDLVEVQRLHQGYF